MKLPKRGLYAITQTSNKTEQHIIAEVAAAVKGGSVLVQYRDKQQLAASRQQQLANALIALCHPQNIPLIINDNIDLALKTAAAGVHLGQHDANIAEARRRLGDNAIIGASCYNNLELAKIAEAEGADYVAFGRFFPSNSKPLATPADLGTLALAKSALSIPIVAIGGILPTNGAALLAAGADILAVIGGIFDYPAEPAARAFLPLFESEHECKPPGIY
ncbi:MAG: thiamine phosphate synthase [Methylococcaceae bacterium]|jgi:thiamine-phosphate pyrophosphorylase